MSITAVVLDTSPLGLVTQKSGKSAQADACRLWMENLLASGVDVYVPEIADHELRRELVRAGQTASINRLDRLIAVLRYLPITTEIMHHAAELWAQSRNAGVPTTDDTALDGDVIVCAQAISLKIAKSEIVVATANPKHLERFVAARLWQDL